MKIKLVLRFMVAHWKAQTEYRFAFFADILVQFFAYGVTIINIWMLFRNITTLQGWDFYQIFFLFILNLLSYGITGLFIYDSSRKVEEMVQNGTFDTLLTRPLDTFFHLVLKNFSPLFIAHIILSLLLFLAFLDRFGIIWSLGKVIMLFFTIIGCVLIQASIMIITSSLSFWFTKSTTVVNAMIYGFRNFITYPLTIYNRFIQFLLTFIIPYGFVAYFPATYFFDKNETMFFPALKYGTLFVGLIMIVLAKLVWNAGINSYQSSGH